MRYDYIICGAGAAGLLLAYRMSQDDLFSNKQVLLLDKDPKTSNDRTWCFWEYPNGEWDDLAFKIWDTAKFSSDRFSSEFKLAPYQYKMLRGADFYTFVKEQLSGHSNITFKQAEVTDFFEQDLSVVVKTDNETFHTEKLFNSIFNLDQVKAQSKYPLLQQHFVGWFMKTERPAFRPEVIDFMDFSIPQKGNTRFMYVLPISETEALLEYTLFSPELLIKDEYESGIEEYLHHRDITKYSIEETEQGNIPMSCHPFWRRNTKNILNMGTAGGWTKASTGFTFMNTLHKTDQLTSFLKTGKPLSAFHKKNRFWWYDLLFIDVLYQDNSLGAKLFSELFKNNAPEKVLKFLDEKTAIYEELPLMLSLPKRPFLNALWKRIV